ncbi:MAG TPA: hypothetical protein VM553_00280 [Dongiaceae bacterium]|nr:hypothetical protein [Dongiaceae bacterium]
MNHLLPSGRLALPFMLLFSTLLTGCGAGGIRSSLPNQHTTMYLSQDTTVDFSVTGDTGNDLYYGWQIIQYDSNNQPISTAYLAGESEQARRHTFTASDLSNFRTEVAVTLYRRVIAGDWPIDLPLNSVTWEISKPVEKLGTQIPSSLFLRNKNDLPNLSGISDVTGNVILDDTTFRDVAPLNSLNHIGGNLVVNRSQIRTANDLHLNAALVLDGGLQLRNNRNLTSLTGLESISQLGELIIENNRVLKNLTGLGGLERIDGNLLVKGNAKLADLSGASRLANIDGSLTLDDNAALVSTKGVETLQNIQLDLNLLSNPALASLEGFAGLTRIGGTLAIDVNTTSHNTPSRLTNLSGLDALTHTGSIRINTNPQLASLQGLNSLTTVTNYLYLANNPLLQNLQALDSLTSVRIVSLERNRQLRNLQGLEQVRNLDYLTINGGNNTTPPAEGLNSLTGIEAVGSIKHLQLFGNPLSDLSALDNVAITGSLTLNYNLITALPAIQVDALEGVSIFGERITSLEGLNNVTRLGYLQLHGNNQLADLSGLNALNRVDEGFSIADNQSLCQSAADALLAQVQNAGGVGGVVNMYLNNGCN